MTDFLNVAFDVQAILFPNQDYNFTVQQRNNQRWIIYVKRRNHDRTAKLEFLIDVDPNNPEDVDVAGSVLRFGAVPRETVANIMDSIIERL